jgi:hypothetical protein
VTRRLKNHPKFKKVAKTVVEPNSAEIFKRKLNFKETNILFQAKEKQDLNYLVTSQSSLYVTVRGEM